MYSNFQYFTPTRVIFGRGAGCVVALSVEDMVHIYKEARG